MFRCSPSLLPSAVRVCKDGKRRNTIVATPPSDRFWKFVDKKGENECWLWNGAVTGSKVSYGAFWDGSKLVRAHRFSFELFTGTKIPSKMDGCHTCDIPLCVNPRHIFPGTRQDNADDCKAKGRVRHPILRGEENARTKYSSEQALEVKRLLDDGVKQSEIARLTGVTITSIGAIAQGRTWSHVTGITHRSLYSGPSLRLTAQKRIKERAQKVDAKTTTATP